MRCDAVRQGAPYDVVGRGFPRRTDQAYFFWISCEMFSGTAS
jgi:hypothetical protein